MFSDWINSSCHTVPSGSETVIVPREMSGITFVCTFHIRLFFYYWVFVL
jgi:hypothetical protein